MKEMTDHEQKAIFAENLLHYMAINQKQQTEVARDLGFNATTLNMWCNGKSFPSTSKIRKLADYFRIEISDLTDKKNPSNDNDIKYSDACTKIRLNDERFKKIIIEYNEMPLTKRQLICDFFETFIL